MQIHILVSAICKLFNLHIFIKDVQILFKLCSDFVHFLFNTCGNKEKIGVCTPI